MQNILAVKPVFDLTSGREEQRHREWQASEKGLRETQLKWELRRIDKLGSALATKLRVMEGEAKNQY